MDKQTIADIIMEKRVADYLDNNSGKFTGLKPFEKPLAKAKNYLTEIHAEEIIASIKSPGATEEKTKREVRMCKTCLTISAFVHDYAEDTDNSELAKIVDINKSQLDRAPEEEKVIICEDVLKAATDNVDDLDPDYLINATVIADFQTKIADYNAYITKPKLVIGDSAAALKHVKAVVKKIKQLYKRLDRKMEYFVETQTDFHEGYYTARNIIVPGVRNKVIANVYGLTMDMDSGLPKAGVKVYIFDTKIFVISDAEGKFTLPIYKAIKNGLIIGECDDCIQYSEDITVNAGEDIELNMEMELKEPVVPPEEPTP